MPPWKSVLADEDIHRIADYLWSLQKKKDAWSRQDRKKAFGVQELRQWPILYSHSPANRTSMERARPSSRGASRPQMRMDQLEAKLYRDIDHDDQWIAWSRNIGWVRFRARPNGWAERKPVVELDALHLREVSLAQAFNTGLIEAFHQ
jgi:hypothetical protein